MASFSRRSTRRSGVAPILITSFADAGDGSAQATFVADGPLVSGSAGADASFAAYDGATWLSAQTLVSRNAATPSGIQTTFVVDFN